MRNLISGRNRNRLRCTDREPEFCSERWIVRARSPPNGSCSRYAERGRNWDSVRKSPREVGFFHRIFQEYLAAQHLASFLFNEQIEFVKANALDPRWREVVLCLLYRLQRPNEINALVEIIRDVQAGPEALITRDLLLGEIAFGEFKRSPGLAKRLAENAFDQIETSKWQPPVRHALASYAVEGLSSTALAQRVSQKLTEWFPRWHRYGLPDALAAIAKWPEDEGIARVLWRALHDEFYESSRAAATALAVRYGGQPNTAGACAH